MKLGPLRSTTSVPTTHCTHPQGTSQVQYLELILSRCPLYSFWVLLRSFAFSTYSTPYYPSISLHFCSRSAASLSMLNIARKTFRRVPSFQDILQGRMTHPDMYAYRSLRDTNQRPRRLTMPAAVLLTFSSLVLAQLVWVRLSV